MCDDSVKYIEAKSKEILKELNKSFEGLERKAGIVIGLLSLIWSYGVRYLF